LGIQDNKKVIQPYWFEMGTLLSFLCIKPLFHLIIEAMRHKIFQKIVDEQLTIKSIGHTSVRRSQIRFNAVTKSFLQNDLLKEYLSSPKNLHHASRMVARLITERLYHQLPYIELDNQKEEWLCQICRSLLTDMRKVESLPDIERLYLQRFKTWLRTVSDKQGDVRLQQLLTPGAVGYRETSAFIQMQVLQLTLQKIKGPLLDLGCGAGGYLVNHLRNNNLNAIGLDRVADDSLPYLIQNHWWDYSFEKEAWGTITAHQSFSSHFLRAHLLGSRFVARYAAMYSAILDALQKEGSFHYAPSLPFMERWLDRSRFHVQYTSGSEVFQRTIIRKK
jgi:hypothetical protein